MTTEARNLVDYYLILDVKRNATLDEIEMAYAKMALKHHPDIAGDSPEVQARFSLINEAYSVLSNSVKRQDYDETLGVSGGIVQEEVIASDGKASADPSTPEAAPVSRAAARDTGAAVPGRMGRKKLEQIMGRARKLMKQGDFWRADSLLREALIAYPTDPELRRLLAKAAEGRGRFREAVEELRAAAEAEYFNPENHYLMGRMFIKGGRLENARKAFNDALSWQEDYEPAIRGLEELRSMERAGQPWWKKLFRMGK
jgi:curved DNA-binding protein CbpA